MLLPRYPSGSVFLYASETSENNDSFNVHSLISLYMRRIYDDSFFDSFLPTPSRCLESGTNYVAGAPALTL